ncbi:MAG: alpha/beta hydrolase [Bacteroidota bacterium]
MYAIQAPTKSHAISGGNNTTLSVQEWGQLDATPILFIHAWSQSHLGWLSQIDSDLAKQYRLITFDLRGHGLSAAPPEPEAYTSGDLWADDIHAIINALDLQEVVLVGWSLGSLVALDYLAKYGTNNIKAVNLVAGFNALNVERAQSHLGELNTTLLPQMMASDLGSETMAVLETTKKLYLNRLDSDLLAFIVGYQMVTRPNIRYAMVTRSVDHQATLTHLNIPVLLSHGDQDDIAAVQAAYDAQSFNPSFRLSIYQGAGHAPHAFDAARFNRELQSLIH